MSFDEIGLGEVMFRNVSLQGLDMKKILLYLQSIFQKFIRPAAIENNSEYVASQMKGTYARARFPNSSGL